MNENKIVLGTELKLNIYIPPLGDLTALNYDFQVHFYCNPRKVKSFEKKDLVVIDDNNYIACLDSTEVGVGKLKCNMIAYIPDEDFDDGLRTEIVEITTGYDIVKNI